VFDALMAEAFTGGTPITAADDEHRGLFRGVVASHARAKRREPGALRLGFLKVGVGFDVEVGLGVVGASRASAAA